MSSDITPFSANLVWRRVPTVALEMYSAESNVYFKWVIGLVDGEYHLSKSDAWGNLTEFGVYAGLEQAQEMAEHWELWTHEYRSWAHRNRALVDFPRETA